MPVSLTLVRPVGFIEGVVVSGPTRIPMVGAYVYLYKQNADGTWPPASPYIGSPSYTFNTDSSGAWTSGELPYGSYKVRFFTLHTGSQWWAYTATPETATVLTLSTPGQRLSGIEGWFNR